MIVESFADARLEDKAARLSSELLSEVVNARPLLFFNLLLFIETKRDLFVKTVIEVWIALDCFVFALEVIGLVYDVLALKLEGESAGSNQAS